ncbi:hypothetical protein GCM10023322_18830 [Rugosimonospora acidiphila]|uniref:DUF3558 domain-containing protein n=1 Tax=Rugosimonospora acidiphila TaxID=556531 RepID=A0ABP9RPM5_9ACTN
MFGGGLATALALSRGGNDSAAATAGTRPSASASASSGAVYHKLPGCDSFPSATVTSLVPQGRSTINDHKSTGGDYDGDFCTWDNAGVLDKQPPETREIDLTVTADSDAFTDTPTAAAQKDLADALATAQNEKGNTSHNIAVGAVTPVSGLGPGAFSKTYQYVGDDAPGSGMDIYLVLGNVMVDISYWGLDGTHLRGTPVPDDELSKDVQSAAHAVVAWLAACTDCAS